MANFDVFNGDADGICALQQLRLEHPMDSTLVTGVKRDINLLQRVEAQSGDHITVLDVSLDKNREALERVLAQGANVRYFDHHFAGEIPEHSNLETHIDTSPETCSSLLVDQYLEGKQRIWAVVGAYGDNFHDVARKAAEPLGLSDEQLDELCTLGTCLNYNGYGVTLDDLFFAPDELYRLVSGYADPFAFIKEEPGYQKLLNGYRDDMAKIESLQAESHDEHHALFVLPDEPWARRVSGVYGNDLAQRFPNRAHALATVLPDGDYRISVRAPLATKTGADDLCRAFPTGGGRKAAAGINNLPQDLFGEFVDKFKAAFS